MHYLEPILMLMSIATFALAGFMVLADEASNLPANNAQNKQPSIYNTTTNDVHCDININSILFLDALGSGEYATVYRGVWNNKHVAIKLLKNATDKTSVSDILNEVSLMTQSFHPNVVQFLGACTTRPPYFYVTEVLRGSLHEALKKESFSLRRGLQIALDAAYGINYLHMHLPNPILHRDIKPKNPLFAGSEYQSLHDIHHSSGTIKVADFGLSRMLPASVDGVTTDNYKLSGAGTYIYEAPEVYRKEKYGTKADVFSWGMTLYKIFEGEPFEELSEKEIAKRSAWEDLRPPFVRLVKKGKRQRLRRKVKELIERCWNGDASLRPDFGEVIADVEAMLRRIIQS